VRRGRGDTRGSGAAAGAGGDRRHDAPQPVPRRGALKKLQLARSRVWERDRLRVSATPSAGWPTPCNRGLAEEEDPNLIGLGLAGAWGGGDEGEVRAASLHRPPRVEEEPPCARASPPHSPSPLLPVSPAAASEATPNTPRHRRERPATRPPPPSSAPARKWSTVPSSWQRRRSRCSTTRPSPRR